MPVIGALIGTAGRREEIGRQLQRIGEVAFLDEPAAAIEQSERGRLGALITELPDADGWSAARTITLVAARAPRLPVIVYDRVDRTTVGLLAAIMVPGVQLRCVPHPHAPLAPVLRILLDGAVPPIVAPILLLRLLRAAPAHLHVFLTIVATQAHTGRGLAQLARWAGVTPRTVERRLQRSGWAPARAVLQCARALDVLWLMTEHHWPVRRVQTIRGFAHPSAITRLLRRYCCVTPADVREGVDFRRVLADTVSRVSSASRDDGLR